MQADCCDGNGTLCSGIMQCSDCREELCGPIAVRSPMESEKNSTSYGKNLARAELGSAKAVMHCKARLLSGVLLYARDEYEISRGNKHGKRD